jgi:hypothetical protein
MVRRPKITQQRFAEIARAMYDDDELTGDVLTFALALAELLTRENAPGGPSWPAKVTKHVGARHSDWARWAIAQDLPRHEPVDSGYHTCVGEMIRRPGPCGKSATQRHWLRDPLSGEVTVVGSCNRHHVPIRALEEHNRREWIAAGKRPGPQNAGGQLERYFRGDWDTWYRWARPSWVRPGDALEPPRRPLLTLIRGGLELVDER